MNNFPADAEDYRSLLRKVLQQAIDDYIKLQPPNQRRKTYLQEAFDDAIDMLFDSDYRALNIKNSKGEDMSLKELIELALDKDSVSPKQLKDFKASVIQQALDFWENKDLNTLYIPKTFIIDGHAYRVIQEPDADPYEIDFEEKIIFLAGDFESSTTHETFTHVIMSLIMHHNDVSITAKNLDAISKTLFRTLKMNSSFLGS